MIPVITKSSSCSGIINYNENKVKAGDATLIYQNFLSLTVEEKIDHFSTMALLNSRLRINKFAHIVLSFPTEDRVDDLKGKTITEHYLADLGYMNVPYIVYKHQDTSFHHYHVVTSTIDYDGNKIQDRNDHYRSMEVARSLEKDYGLTPTIYAREIDRQSLSAINSSRYSVLRALRDSKLSAAELAITEEHMALIINQQLDNQKIQKLLTAHGFQSIVQVLKSGHYLSDSKKTQLIQKLDTLLEQSSDVNDFQNKLKSENIYFRTLIDKSGNTYIKYGDPLNKFYVSDRRLPERFRFHTLTHHATRSDELAQRKYIRQCAIRCLSKSSDLPHYLNLLKRYQIGVDLARNAGGIYGISFYSLSEQEPILFKGSDLDRKSLNWNALSTHFSSSGENIDLFLPPSFKEVLQQHEKHALSSKLPAVAELSRSLDTSYEEQSYLAEKRRKQRHERENER